MDYIVDNRWKMRLPTGCRCACVGSSYAGQVKTWRICCGIRPISEFFVGSTDKRHEAAQEKAVKYRNDLDMTKLIGAVIRDDQKLKVELTLYFKNISIFYMEMMAEINVEIPGGRSYVLQSMLPKVENVMEVVQALQNGTANIGIISEQWLKEWELVNLLTCSISLPDEDTALAGKNKFDLFGIHYNMGSSRYTIKNGSSFCIPDGIEELEEIQDTKVFAISSDNKKGHIEVKSNADGQNMGSLVGIKLSIVANNLNMSEIAGVPVEATGAKQQFVHQKALVQYLQENIALFRFPDVILDRKILADEIRIISLSLRDGQYTLQLVAVNEKGHGVVLRVGVTSLYVDQIPLRPVMELAYAIFASVRVPGSQSKLLLPYGLPEDYLFEHESRKGPPAGIRGDANVFWVRSSRSGTDFQPIPIKRMLEENGHTDTDIYLQIAAENPLYQEDTVALEFAKLFRVDRNKFHTAYDREGLIHLGQFHYASMFSSLRSLSWMLASVADQQDREFSEYSFAEIQKTADFIENEHSHSFEAFSYFPGLCDQPDCHVIYAPDSLIAEKRKELAALCQLNDSPIRSVDALRHDLILLEPVMRTIHDGLLQNRNRSEELTGVLADALAVWCALCVAAKEPFFSEDGPYQDDILTYPTDSMDADMDAVNAASKASRAYLTCGWDKKKSTTAKKAPPSKTAAIQPEAIPAKPIAEKSTAKKPVEKAEGTQIKEIAGERNTVKEQPAVEANEEFSYMVDEEGSLHICHAGVIPANAFKNNLEIKKAIIPEGVVSIEDYAFNGCIYLETVALPESLEELGESAFQNCCSLTSIKIPHKVTMLADDLFNDCDHLQSIELHNGIQRIGANTFWYCLSLQEIYIPDSVFSIGSNAFDGCISLQKVRLSENLQEIEESTFEGCWALTEISIPYSVTAIHKKAFDHCFSLRRIRIPGSVKRIGEESFSYCSSLGLLELEEGIQELGNSICSDCKSLKEIIIPSTVREIGFGAFSLLDLTSITLLSDKIVPSEDYFDLGYYLVTCRLPSSLRDWVNRNSPFDACDENSFQIEYLSPTRINAFKLTPGKRSTAMLAPINRQFSASAFDISSNGTLCTNGSPSIGTYAYDNRTDIRKVIIPEGVTKIETGAFCGCSNLESIVLPQTLLEIERSAFQNCRKLTRIEIPASVQNIGDFCFWSCISLQEIVLHDGLTTIEDYAFYNCISLRKLRIPGSVKALGNNVFGRCHLLEHLELQGGIEELADMCFGDNSALTEITIPSSVHIIGNNAFNACNNLKTLTLLCEKANPEDAFDWGRIQNLTLPESMMAWAQNSERISRCENLHIHYFAPGEDPKAPTDAESIEAFTLREDSAVQISPAESDSVPAVVQNTTVIENPEPPKIAIEISEPQPQQAIVPPREDKPISPSLENTNKVESVSPETPAEQPAAAPSTRSLMRRAKFFLEDEDFDQATVYFNRVLDITPEYASAYIGLLCAENKLHSEAELADLPLPISDSKLFKRAMQFASEDQKKRYTAYNDAILKRQEEKKSSEAPAIPKPKKTSEEITQVQQDKAKETKIKRIKWEIAELKREQNEASGIFAGMKRKKLQKQIDELNEDLRRLRRGF